MLDLASAMKYNPDLKVQLNAGYFDLATPFFEGVYESGICRFRPNCRRTSNSSFINPGIWSTPTRPH
jgi:hypothetical protein